MQLCRQKFISKLNIAQTVISHILHALTSITYSTYTDVIPCSGGGDMHEVKGKGNTAYIHVFKTLFLSVHLEVSHFKLAR